ncbi:MAG: hypothetical protein ACW97X_14725 [Candidatus Hodarchaeales archaeon]|jgi:hypothetical protein
MSWRNKYVGWYFLLKEIFDDLVPDLTNDEILHNVSRDDILVIPTIFEDAKPTDKKYVPNLFMILTNERIRLGLVFGNKKSVDNFQNIFHEANIEIYNRLFKILSELPNDYETKLFIQNNSKEKEKLLRKYITNKLDTLILDRLFDEAKYYRQTRREEKENKVIYKPPQKTKIYLIEQNIPLDQVRFVQSLQNIKPIYEVLFKIKNKREIIKSKLAKPKRKKKEYRNFIEIVNDVRSKGLISAEKRREYDKKWRTNEDEREFIILELKEKLQQAS